jgi:DNA-binding transcriptional regulator YiaG
MSSGPPYSSLNDTEQGPIHKPQFRSSSKKVSRFVHARHHNSRTRRAGSRVAALSPDEYRELLEQSGITQVGASRMLGVNEKTSRNWARNGVTGTAAIILRLYFWDKVSGKEIIDAAMGSRLSPTGGQGR